MAKKSKLSKDAFDWVKSTSPEAETPPPPEAKKETTPSRALLKKEKTPGERTIFVRHKKRSGEIVSIVETITSQEEITAHPFFNVPADEDVTKFKLTEDLRAKELIEIHSKYKVEGSGKTLKLVPKK